MVDDVPLALRAARAVESASGVDALADDVRGVVARVLAARPGLADALHGRQVGHPLHPLLTDLPLGLWTGAAVLDLVGGRDAQASADRLLGLGVLAALPTAISGYADWAVSDGPRIRRVGLVHAALNVASVALFGTSWLLRRADRRGAGVAVAMAANVLVTAGGYLGGHLTLRLGAPTGGPVAAGRPADDEAADLDDDAAAEGRHRAGRSRRQPM